MNEPKQPLRPIQKLTRPLVRFLHVEAASGVVLLIATALALTAANTPFGDTYEWFWNLKFTVGVESWSLSYPLWYWVNDGLMALFFFLVGLEIKREIVAGELREVRRIISPAAAAIGGAVVPAVVYITLLGDEAGQQGWAIPMATDIAFVVGALALLGKRVPHGLKVFLLTLAIVDDIIAVLVIALFYSSKLSLVWMGAAVFGVTVVVVMNRLGVRTVFGYLLVGVLVWLCTLKSGIHPTISGVVLGLLTPAAPLLSKNKLIESLNRAGNLLSGGMAEGEGARLREVTDEVDFVARESVSPLERFETGVHPWAAFIIMPVFALANAGVPVTIGAAGSTVSTAVAAGLLIGKPVGIVLAMFLVVKSRFGSMPGGAGWGAVFGGCCLAGIGFTMSLFVASLSMEGRMLVEAKTGILIGSAASGLIGFTGLILSLKKKAE